MATLLAQILGHLGIIGGAVLHQSWEDALDLNIWKPSMQKGVSHVGATWIRSKISPRVIWYWSIQLALANFLIAGASVYIMHKILESWCTSDNLYLGSVDRINQASETAKTYVTSKGEKGVVLPGVWQFCRNGEHHGKVNPEQEMAAKTTVMNLS
ncbi:hypothetical protein BKA64DRAFT_473731 [Cadophora sp. MPI-SDFR-AT-0126]|nr:hypothetical protein BKA64DRAFT_473731 [Leotiomycetes sp. MPI-SDFR-AT-0126]